MVVWLQLRICEQPNSENCSMIPSDTVLCTELPRFGSWRLMKSVPPRGSGWVNAAPSLRYRPTRYREVVLTPPSDISVSTIIVCTFSHFDNQILLKNLIFNRPNHSSADNKALSTKPVATTPGSDIYVDAFSQAYHARFLGLTFLKL